MQIQLTWTTDETDENATENTCATVTRTYGDYDEFRATLIELIHTITEE